MSSGCRIGAVLARALENRMGDRPQPPMSTPRARNYTSSRRLRPGSGTPRACNNTSSRRLRPGSGTPRACNYTSSSRPRPGSGTPRACNYTSSSRPRPRRTGRRPRYYMSSCCRIGGHARSLVEKWMSHRGQPVRSLEILMGAGPHPRGSALVRRSRWCREPARANPFPACEERSSAARLPGSRQVRAQLALQALRTPAGAIAVFHTRHGRYPHRSGCASTLRLRRGDA